MENTASVSRRLTFLDTLRGLAVILMTIYHIEYDLVFIFGAPWLSEFYFKQMEFASWIFTAPFVFLAGITVRFSREPAKHGAKLLFIASGFTLVTAFIFPGSAIYFGILHLIASGMLLYSLCSKVINRIPWWVGLILSALIFSFTYNIPKGFLGFEWLRIELPAALTGNSLLYPFGFISRSFSSVDFLPIFPWVFLFFCGVFTGWLVTERKMPEFAYRDLCPPLSWLGRHSLVYYIVHQPVIYALLYVLYNFILKK